MFLGKSLLCEGVPAKHLLCTSLTSCKYTSRLIRYDVYINKRGKLQQLNISKTSIKRRQCAEEDVFDLSDSLGSVADTTYDETIRILTEYLAPQRNVECEVFVFHQEAQASKENLDTFST